MRPVLWNVRSPSQVFLSTLINHPLGPGPALAAAAFPPDLHHFRGSYGAKEVLPLYRDSAATESNVLIGIMELLAVAYGHDVTTADVVAYLYGILAQPEYTGRFGQELANREIRVPLTKNADLFEAVASIGRRLLWLHTYGERFHTTGGDHPLPLAEGEQARRYGQVPRGQARCVRAVPDDPEQYPEDFQYNTETRTLHVGDGAFAPVEADVYEFEVSGLKVVQSWLGYRMKRPHGRRSSPLDDIGPERWTAEFTTQLLELLWVLEATVEIYPEQAELLSEVIAGDLFTADELPEVPEEARQAPRAQPAEDEPTIFRHD